MFRHLNVLSVSAIALLVIALLWAGYVSKVAPPASHLPAAFPSKVSRPASGAAEAFTKSTDLDFSPVENKPVQFSSASIKSASSADSGTQHQFVWDEAQAIPVDPVSPGNTLSVREQQVSVQSYQKTAQGNALSVLVTPKPSPSTGSSVKQMPESEVLETQPPSAVALQQISRPSIGFTHEEELFRTKWGWNAFAQVQREAALHPDDTP